MKRDKLLQRWSGVYLSALFLLLPLWLHRGYFDITETKTVDTHIKRLRNKIAAAGIDPAIIETVRGYGYRLRA